MKQRKPFVTLFVLMLYFIQGHANEDFSAKVERFELTTVPMIGTTAAGQQIELGGFSGLRFLGKTADGKLLFLTHTDRGPNPEFYIDQGKVKRPFPIPDFNPRLVILVVDPINKTLQLRKQIPLKNFVDKLITGLPRSATHNEQPVDISGKNIPFDPLGMDLESIDVAGDQSYWMGDEYGPSIAHFSPQGQLIELFSPGKGLPQVLEQRQLNRGFEGLALQGEKVYALVQSPLDNPKSKDERNGKKSKNIRLIEFDSHSKQTTGQFLYLLVDKEADRLGDMVSLGNGRFLVIEQNIKTDEHIDKKIFLIDLTQATNLEALDNNIIGAGGSLESLTPKEIKAKGIQPVRKQEILNLAALGIKDSKVEGITVVGPNQIALIVDNDFSLDGTLDRTHGIIGLQKNKTNFYLITLPNKL
ncbi:esterase-like activity of phytase family protein [Legionella dresdenensis]|uniref:Esterase-like activity of phytase family protein n=1 Tax=Legionella dresdenensis TaxID=450200 RepID=A0ABV8CCU7_9GAMM